MKGNLLLLFIIPHDPNSLPMGQNPNVLGCHITPWCPILSPFSSSSSDITFLERAANPEPITSLALFLIMLRKCWSLCLLLHLGNAYSSFKNELGCHFIWEGMSDTPTWEMKLRELRWEQPHQWILYIVPTVGISQGLSKLYGLIFLLSTLLSI